MVHHSFLEIVLMKTNLLNAGPALFLAQPFSPNRAGWNSLEACCKTAGAAGYRGGIQLPLWDGRLIDLKQAAASKAYCDDLHAKAIAAGCKISSVANHLNTNLVCVSPSYAAQLSLFAPESLHFAPVSQLQNWADEQVKLTVLATKNLGFDRCAAFSGGVLFPYVYKWPAQPGGLVHNGMLHLARRWMPHFNFAQQHGVRWGFELHPGMDLVCGGSLAMFLDNKYAKNHPAACINLDVSHSVLMGMTPKNIEDHIRQCASRIVMWHIKDAEYLPNGEWGVYCYQPWINCPGQFRSLGDGQVDYPRLFSLARELGIDVVPTVEWECSRKGIQQGIVEEGAAYVEACITGKAVPAKTTPRAHSDVFDAFAGGNVGRRLIASMIGIPEAQVDLTA